jgi:hypothetical protein
MLKYLSIVSLKLFECLDKVILINCEYAGFRYTHGQSLYEYRNLIKDLTEPKRL